MNCGGSQKQHPKVQSYTPKKAASPLTRHTSKPAKKMSHSNMGTFGVPTIKSSGFRIGR